MNDSGIENPITGSKTGRIDTLIIGAGVAGLTLAALLRQRGENPVIIEKEKNLDNFGYHLALYPHGSRVLHGLGLYGKYINETVSLNTYNLHNSKGEILHSFPLQEMNDQYGAVRGITRKQLIELLLEATGNLKIHLSTTVKSITQNNRKVNVSFSDGTSHAFDLVVAADGLHSETRKMVFDEKDYSYFETGWGGWIFWVDPIPELKNTLAEYWGAGIFMWTYPIKDHTGIFVGGPVDKMKKDGIKNFTGKVQAQFGRHNKDIGRMLENINENAFFWNFHDCRANHWRQGRVILLGDSAAGFLPTAGVGASMAMESAAALNDELSRTSSRYVEQALDLFEKRRKHRVEANQKNSRELARLIFLKSPILDHVRDQAMKVMTIKMLFKDITGSIEEPI